MFQSVYFVLSSAYCTVICFQMTVFDAILWFDTVFSGVLWCHQPLQKSWWQWHPGAFLYRFGLRHWLFELEFINNTWPMSPPGLSLFHCGYEIRWLSCTPAARGVCHVADQVGSVGKIRLLIMQQQIEGNVTVRHSMRAVMLWNSP